MNGPERVPPLGATGLATLSGVVVLEGRLGGARLRVFDQTGRMRETLTDERGCYSLAVDGLSGVLLLSVEETAPQHAEIHPGWWRKLAALCPPLRPGQQARANLNALTDRIASEVAGRLRVGEPGLVGPQALVERGHTAGIDAGMIAQAARSVRELLGDAPGHVGLPAAWFDPLSVSMEPAEGRVDELLSLLIHQRGLDNPSGLPGACLLLDAGYRFVGRFDSHSAPEPLDYLAARRSAREMHDPQRRRLVVVGDSTAANYERARFPRMGWGQVLRECFRPDALLTVVNAAKSGRSSRAFIEQGYLARVRRILRPGDFLFIQFGDNDASANRARPGRGQADVDRLATWPDDDEGRPQHPPTRPDLSFRHSLQAYVETARACSAIPVLLTPATRLLDAGGRPGVPVVPSHITRHRADTAYAFVGDYAQTVRNTALASSVPLVDVEAMTIAFANGHPDDWQRYWLAVDPERYPWYASQLSGTLAAPDPLHFQQTGAELIAGMVAQRIRELGEPRLAPLVAMLG